MLPIDSLASSHSWAAEQAAPGRNLAGWIWSHLLSTPAITLIVVAASSSLFRASFSSVALPFSASFSLRAVLSSLMMVLSPFLDMNSSVYSARKLNFFLMLSRSVVAA